MNHPQRTIAILGAGFSGTAVAIHLLQRPAGSPLRVVLLDRETTGRGLAYADRGYPYLLNVPAGRMSANADEPLDFLNFAQTHIPTATAHDFLPRSLYGEYLQARLLAAERAAAPDVVLERIFATAVSIKCGINDRRYCVRLADGARCSPMTRWWHSATRPATNCPVRSGCADRRRISQTRGARLRPSSRANASWW